MSVRAAVSIYMAVHFAAMAKATFLAKILLFYYFSLLNLAWRPGHDRADALAQAEAGENQADLAEAGAANGHS